MIELVALRPIFHGVGTIKSGQPFRADQEFANKLIDEGAAVLAREYDSIEWTGDGYWRVQPHWKGQTAVIVAGGPTVTSEQIDAIGRAEPDPKIIAVNNAAKLVPWADILYFCDERWYHWNHELVHEFDGLRVTLENLSLQRQGLDVRSLRDYGVNGFAPKNDGVTNGRNSGYQALHLAALLGAARVLLVGYDMRQVDGRMHWHPEHPVATPANIFPGWIAAFATLAPELERRGVEVINCTPGSALTMFKTQDLEVALGLKKDGADKEQEFFADAPSPPNAPPRSEDPEPQPVAEQPDPVQPPAYAQERAGEFGGAGASGDWQEDR